MKNIKKSGKCVKGEAFISLKCKFEFRNGVLDIGVHFLAISHNLEKKLIKASELGSNVKYFFN